MNETNYVRRGEGIRGGEGRGGKRERERDKGSTLSEQTREGKRERKRRERGETHTERERGRREDNRTQYFFVRFLKEIAWHVCVWKKEEEKEEEKRRFLTTQEKKISYKKYQNPNLWFTISQKKYCMKIKKKCEMARGVLRKNK